jgi:ABC-2 type transport system ATP-binding protein
VAPVKLKNIPKTGADVTIELPAVILNATIGDQIAVGIFFDRSGF